MHRLHGPDLVFECFKVNLTKKHFEKMVKYNKLASDL